MVDRKWVEKVENRRRWGGRIKIETNWNVNKCESDVKMHLMY